MLMYIWTMIRWKSHVEKLHVSRFTGPKRLQMAKIETFCDISWNVEIRPIWFSELRTVVIVASICWKPYVFKVFHFRVIHWPRGPEKQQKTTKWGEKSVFFFTFFVYICILSQATYVFWQSKLIQLHPETLGAFLGKIGHIWEISPRPSFSKQNVDLVIFCVSTISIDLDSYCSSQIVFLEFFNFSSFVSLGFVLFFTSYFLWVEKSVSADMGLNVVKMGPGDIIRNSSVYINIFAWFL